ncbi:anti-sigma-F factor Fin [Virgibacillus natechei]|uniref:anti-sigma-F factor Fin n=1 Tax=Virgibacillus sp. CBA3643 TaxID=2942278 RepID=UPI0035A30F94
MAIVYKCRHCGNEIGKLEEKVVDTSLLGFDKLSTKDKKEMIHYADNGDVHIQAICENCEETLGHHPHYHELDFFIQ